MANLFDGFDKASNEDIITQVALLNTMTMPNIMAPYGQKAAKSVVNVVNILSKFINDKNLFDEPKVETINEKLDKEIIRLQYFPREELNKMLHSSLFERVDLNNNNYSEEALSCAIIEEAAKHKDLNIDEYLTPSQKADSITQRFMERMYSSIQKKLREENSLQAQKTIAILEQNINKMPENKQEELKKLLKVDDLTGETVREAMLSMTPALLLGTTSLCGFGSFAALTTIIHAVFTTALGITLPFAAYTTATSALSILTGPIGWSLILGVGAWQIWKGSNNINRELLAQSVFCAITSYGKPLAPQENELPSWIPKENIIEHEKIKQADEEIKRLIQERDDAVYQYKQQAIQINQLLQDLEHNKKLKEDAQNKKLKYKNEAIIIQQQKHDLLKQIHELQQEKINDRQNDELYKQKIQELQDDVKVKEQAIAEYNRIFDEVAIKENAYINKINEQEQEKINLIAKFARLENITKQQQHKLDLKQEKIIKFLSDHWHISYSHLEYAKSFLKEVASYSYDIRLELERVLAELNNSKDVRTMSRGKLANSNIDHTAVQGNNYRLCWEHLSNGQVRLLKFGTHAEINRYYKNFDK